MRMRCGLEFAFALHSHQCELPKSLASHANSHSHRITSPGDYTVNASNFGPHGNFEPFLARSVASLGEFCAKDEQNRLC
jgi:hypothetical protein